MFCPLPIIKTKRGKLKYFEVLLSCVVGYFNPTF